MLETASLESTHYNMFFQITMQGLVLNRKKSFDGIKFGGRSIDYFHPFINLSELKPKCHRICLQEERGEKRGMLIDKVDECDVFENPGG